jgi:hypothetical protein
MMTFVYSLRFKVQGWARVARLLQFESLINSARNVEPITHGSPILSLRIAEVQLERNVEP